MNKVIKNVYIHLPFCLKKCYFCAFPVHAIGHTQTQHTQKIMENYINHLKKQIIIGKQHYHTVVKNNDNTNKNSILNQSCLETIYFGGGTPSLFKPHQISQLINLVKSISNISTTNDPQITLEINPQQIQSIPDFHSAGVNRFSIGIQSLNPQQLNKFNRSESLMMSKIIKSQLTTSPSYKLIKKHREEYFHKIVQKLISYINSGKLINFNVDFILDLNPQKQDQQIIYKFIETVKPPHLTLYLLEVIENTYLEKKINYLEQQNNSQLQLKTKETEQFSGLVRNFQTIHQRYIQVSDKLKEKYGYCHYEVSNFAKIIKKENYISPFQSKHNKAYWQGNREFIGFGMGASSLLKAKHLNPYYRSLLPSIFNDHKDKTQSNEVINQQQQLFRVTNPRSIGKYYQYVNQLQSLFNKNQQHSKSNHKQFYYQSSQTSGQLKRQQNKKQPLVEICLQTSPIGVLQSYIMSSIRTLSGVSYDRMKMMMHQSNHIEQTKVQSYYKYLIERIEQTLNNQFNCCQKQKDQLSHHREQYQSQKKQNQYFQFIYSHQMTNLSNKPISHITGFKLKSPHGYLVADQIAHKISILVEDTFKNKT